MTGNIRKHTLLLTCANGVTRAMGFVLRLVMARLMGAEALGVMEMAHSVEMLALTPLTAGTPVAMSRLTARASEREKSTVLHAGLWLVIRASMVLAPAALLLSPLISHLLGDKRTLLVLLVNTPCIPLLGMCSVYAGYCYGLGNMKLPAITECVEQFTRCVVAIALLLSFRNADASITAALPCFAELCAACLLVLIFAKLLPVRRLPKASAKPLADELRRLATPTIMSRLCTTCIRAFNAVLIPSCLRISGLSAAAATAQYGLLSGMALPVLMLPGIATSALSMAATPAIARMEHAPHQLHSLIRRLRLAATIIGVGAGVVIVICSDFISTRLYNTPALASLLRILAPMTLLMALQQVQYGMIAGLGLQRQQLTGSIIGSGFTTAFISLLAPLPHMRLYGAAIAMLAGQTVTLIWGAVVLTHHIRTQSKQKVLAKQA